MEYIIIAAALIVMLFLYWWDKVDLELNEELYQHTLDFLSRLREQIRSRLRRN